MSEVSPWSRLGIIERIEEEAVVPSNDILVIKDQITELSRLLMSLVERVNSLEMESKPPIDNLLEIISPEELGLVPITVDEVEEDPTVVVVKSGFAAPNPDELLQIREAALKAVEPSGDAPDETSEPVVEQKEFGEEYGVALIMADLLIDYIKEHGAILNNQVKKRVYAPVELNVGAKDKKLLKELIEEGHTKFKANKMDSFRTLYYIGEDYAEEYEKSYGQASS
jgi:hypothetical protein